MTTKIKTNIKMGKRYKHESQDEQIQKANKHGRQLSLLADIYI